MLRFFRRYGYAIFMGIALPMLFKTQITDWEYWVFSIIMALLVVIREDK